MTQHQTFMRIHMLRNFLHQVGIQKQKLLTELITNATDPTIQMRRFRMLSQLSLYESQTIQKIAALETDDLNSFLDQWYETEIAYVVDRNA